MDFVIKNCYIKELARVKDYNISHYDKCNQSMKSEIKIDCSTDEITKYLILKCYFVQKDTYYIFTIQYRHGVLVVTDCYLNQDAIRLLE